MRNSKQERHQMKDKGDIKTTLVINQVHHKMYITFFIHQNVMFFYHAKQFKFCRAVMNK
jgi:hypothetical protein